MITQTAAKDTKICSTCPYFNNFNEPNHRGWCNQFDHQVRGHHEATNNCLISDETLVSHQLEDNLALFPDVNFEARKRSGFPTMFHALVEELDAFLSEEIQDSTDLPRSEYQIGSIVKVIDEGEHYSEWGVFEVVECRHNSHLYDTADTYLNQAEWYYCLSSLQYTNLSSSPFKSLWIAENDICDFNMAHNVNTNDMRSGIL